METKTFTVMTDSEWDLMVMEHFPVHNQYSIVADLELSNDGDKAFMDIKKDDLEKAMLFKWDKSRWEEFVMGKVAWGCSVLLMKYFVSIGVIPEGNILIRVSW